MATREDEIRKAILKKGMDDGECRICFLDMDGKCNIPFHSNNGKDYTLTDALAVYAPPEKGLSILLASKDDDCTVVFASLDELPEDIQAEIYDQVQKAPKYV